MNIAALNKVIDLLDKATMDERNYEGLPELIHRYYKEKLEEIKDIILRDE
jgi:hypothetical protein